MSLDKRTKDEILKRFQLHEKDTGSADVQIAILSEKITEMSEHCKKNAKDRSARLALLKLVAARRRLLEYLNSTDTKRYRSLISRLNLRR
ncbi:30S ribosomal protein S15 [Candidatus Similichlamydia laticola]|uniref:Small ribosomal subunit protein uS15 n=1 Tax=Candidatus Similichlamydia laticola TaxID=2170265 RepID=A0A369KFZ1_9BACT|nr:30S ribosomal protein S15 [Candidatus Similichlamydia laticola]RDB31625.1 SSU ribosomal protein S15p (S13e) [Candidatus Similichlamydia laticola]